MKSVFDYLDYREFLADRFVADKEAKDFYSLRYVESKTGIDASYYSKILKKQKHVGTSKVQSLLALLNLQGKEKIYLDTLIRFNKENDNETASELFEKLVSLRTTLGRQVTDFDYYCNWYVVPVRELLSHYDFTGNYEDLAAQFSPEITPSQAESSIKILKELKLIEVNEDGFLRPIDAIITSGDTWKTVAIGEFQKQMIRLGAASINSFEKDFRDISTITLSTSYDSLEFIGQRLKQARREIMEYITAKEEVEGVFQINMQVFPLTKVKK